MIVLLLMVVVAGVHGGPTTEAHKDQFCTDPRTMKKHPAYTEWADAYSCTRHRCQPGGRNLAIYTVGCKRVEAPESAIECEEVVEDTNMQFPYCCTRLRCLVVVRGEVWTRVLGQPWETLPAAPWSHMYKMKKPPPGENAFLLKTPGEGPIYELATDSENINEKVLRSDKKPPVPDADCIDGVAPAAPRAVPAPDIVIALSTTNDAKDQQRKKVENNNSQTNKKTSRERYKRNRKQPTNPYIDDDNPEHRNEIDVEEQPAETEKPSDTVSEEKYYVNKYGVTQKPFKVNKKKPQQLQQHLQVAWTEIPPSQWNEHETPMAEVDTALRDGSHLPDFASPPTEEKKGEKPSNLQALVDAIGTRMRDIENVVQRMSEKVQQAKPGQPDYVSDETKILPDTEAAVPTTPRKHHKGEKESKEPKELKDLGTKRPNPEGDNYKRFSVRNRGSKYLHTIETTTEPPIFVEDTSLNGYFSDASNSVVRRSNSPKEPSASTYMAPVETRRKTPHILVSEVSEEEKKHKKHAHKKKKNKSRTKKKHHKDEKKKRVPKVSSVELERNAVSLEDSSAVASK